MLFNCSTFYSFLRYEDIMQYPTERELLHLVSNGNEKAFAILYNRFQPEMLKLAIKKFLTKQEAEDIVQEIFISIWQRRKLISDKIPLKFYLLRAVHLQYAQYCRHSHVLRKYYRYQRELNLNADYYDYLENKELGRQIKTAINCISASACKRIFELAYIDDKNCNEIASSLKIRVQVVRNQTSRALKVIRKELRKVV